MIFYVCGIPQRRWIVVSNPSLSSLITKWLGTETWIRNVDLLSGLRDHASNPELQQEWKMVASKHYQCLQFLRELLLNTPWMFSLQVRKVNKMRLAEFIEAMTGIKVCRVFLLSNCRCFVASLRRTFFWYL